MTRSSIHTAVLDLHMTHEEASEIDIADGKPTVAVTPMENIGECAVGIWEMTPGALKFVEQNELIVVLSGKGRVEFVDEGHNISIQAGSLIQVREGQRTVWHITKTLRKVYITAE